PDTNAPWPSMRLDPLLLDDYRRTFALMQQLGYNAIVIWCFYVSRSWPLDSSSAVPPERGALVGKLSDAAHEQGVSVYPGPAVAVSGWGMRLDDPESLPALVDRSRSIDYLIDVRDSARQRDPSWRRKLIGELACSFGTLGGPQVEPPQHLARDRWFLPTVRRG